MAGALAPAADTRVALKAVASIDHLIENSPKDDFLTEILVSAADILQRANIEARLDLDARKDRAPKYLH